MKKYIPLKEMIEQLGYTNAEDISNWMQEGILKKKEDFKKHLRDPKSPGNTRRVTHKTHICEDARTLVDNLCVIYSFQGLFPVKGDRYATTQYRPYQELKSGEFKNHLGARAEKQRKNFQIQRNRNDNAIANFDTLLAALESQEAIDITKESIRELMHKTSCSPSAVAFNPYELSSWNSLIEQRNHTENNPQDSVAHQKLAESLYILNMIDESLLELEKATRLSQENGIAWAIKSKILLEMLTPSRREYFQTLAMNQFSGHISSPITSEEHWINERIDETAESVEELRNEFIEAALNALENWPCWEHPTLNPGKNYHPYTSISNNCKLKIERGWLYFHLIMNLRPIDLFKHIDTKQRLLDIYNTWIKPNDTYTFPSLHLDYFSEEQRSEDEFLIRLTAYMAQISQEKHSALLNEFIQTFKRHEHSANKNLNILRNSLISKHFLKHLGYAEYYDLYLLLESYKRQNDEHEKLNFFSKEVASNIQSAFDTSIKLYDQHFNECNYRHREDTTKHVTEKQVETEFSAALIKSFDMIESFDFLINRKAIYNIPEPRKLHQGYGELMLYLPLIEYNLTASKEAINIITFFTDNPEHLECCISSEDYNLLSLFGDFWMHEKRHPQAKKPTTFFNKAQDILQQRFDDEFEID